jgi:hypothetical protein
MQQETSLSARRFGGLNVNQLKYLAAAFMVIDNAYFSFDTVIPAWVHLITRFVAPLFAFLMVEGFFHTHDRRKYLLRLWLAAWIMEAGDFLSLAVLGKKYQIYDNIFLTLAVAFTLIYLFESGKLADEKRKKVLFYVLGGLLLAAGYYFSLIPVVIGNFAIGLEGGMQLLSVVLIFYFFYGNRRKQITVFLIWNAMFLLLMGGIVLPGNYSSLKDWFDDFCSSSDGLVFLFLPFVFLYNGQKGRKSAFNQYFFYIFYPAHLWIIHLAAFLLRGGMG